MENSDKNFLCGRCNIPLPMEVFNSNHMVECPLCFVKSFGRLFPAMFVKTESNVPQTTLLNESEASCFYHERNRAIIACNRCGRFLCSLCDIDLNSEHVCPACIETGMKKGKFSRLDQRRILYDDLALSLALLPLLIFYFTLITAPISLYVAIRYWNAPRSIIPRTKFRFIMAIFIASLELIAWGAFFYVLFR